jgi:hypothetical protein
MNYIVSPTPHMDEDGLNFFRNAIAEARCYLEYGAGGSTVYACNEAKVPFIISVDTDPLWVNNVSQSLTRNPASGVVVQLCDLGEVEAWGFPKSKDKIGDFWRYMSIPWDLARSNRLVPDLIFIDGRFRVASFLYSLLNARVGTTILFDDYMNRPEYFVVEKFCKLVAAHGRLGQFSTSPSFDVVELCAQIAKYSIDCR